MNKWDVVLLAFPFTDLSTIKVRPAVVISPNDDNSTLEDGVFLLITSNTTRTSAHDLLVPTTHTEYPATGLVKESAIRIDKIFTLRKSLVRRTLGTLGPVLQQEVAARLKQYLQL